MSVTVSVNYLRKTLYPVFLLAAICGVQMFEYRMVFLNYIQYIVMWSIYIGSFWCLWVWSDFSYLFETHMYRFVVFTNAITSLMATALTLLHKKKFQRILEDLTIINNTFGDLNIPNDCLKLKRMMWKTVGLWCMTVLYFIISDASWMTLVFGKMLGSLVVLVIDTPYLINVIAYIIVCLVLSYTESRFDLLNKHIEQLMSQKGKGTCWRLGESYGVTGRLNPMTISKRRQDIWTLMRMHAELCKICRDLNTIFGVQITFEVASYFIYVCAMAIYFCTIFNFKDYIYALNTLQQGTEIIIRLLMTLSWACIYIGRLFYFNHICETASAQARKTEKLMYDFLNCTQDFQLQEEMRQFILYMISRPLRFYGAGLFCFGYEFIHMFFSGILTVVVIILQMRNPDVTTFGHDIPQNTTSDLVILSNDTMIPVNNSYFEV